MKQRDEQAVGCGEGTTAAVKVGRAGPPDDRLIWDGYWAPFPNYSCVPCARFGTRNWGARNLNAKLGAPNLADNEELA